MLILAVDTSTRAGSLAVLREDAVLGSVADRSDKPYSSRLFSDLDSLLGQVGIVIGQIDLFAVAAGPGSFTGLRIGLTAVKAWAEIFRKPIAAVSALEAIADEVPLSSETPSGAILAPVLDARRGQVFGGLYRRRDGVSSALEPMAGDMLAGVDEYLRLVEEHAGSELPVFASPTPDVIRDALARSAFRAARVESVSAVLAPAIGRRGYFQALRGEVVDALHLDANYIRRPDAEVNWKDG